MIAKLRPHALAQPRLHPAGMSKFDGDRKISELRTCTIEHRGCLSIRTNPWRELQQDGPELSGLVQRRDRVSELAPHFVAQRRRQILRVDARSLEILRQLVS